MLHQKQSAPLDAQLILKSDRLTRAQSENANSPFDINVAEAQKGNKTGFNNPVCRSFAEGHLT